MCARLGYGAAGCVVLARALELCPRTGWASAPGWRWGWRSAWCWTARSLPGLRGYARTGRAAGRVAHLLLVRRRRARADRSTGKDLGLAAVRDCEELLDAGRTWTAGVWAAGRALAGGRGSVPGVTAETTVTDAWDFAVELRSDPATAEARAAVLAKPCVRAGVHGPHGGGQLDGDRGWHDQKVTAYAPLKVSPAAAVLHYSQEIFEGLKAYRHADGSVWAFRPDRNAARFTASAAAARAAAGAGGRVRRGTACAGDGRRGVGAVG